MPINYTYPQDDTVLQAILHLQAANLPRNLTKAEAAAQGFLSVEQDIDLLRKMNEPYGHTVALDGNKLAGYALTMTTDLEERIPFLAPFFQSVKDLDWQGVPLRETPHVLMGQVCVAKAYRGQGVFGRLYQKMRQRMASHFNVIITEISAHNTRSLRAHEREGFEVILAYDAPDGHPWVVVGLSCG